MREQTFCIICKNKGADQLHGNREAVQRICFRYMDSTIPLLSKSKIFEGFLSHMGVEAILVMCPGLICAHWFPLPIDASNKSWL